MVVGGESEKGGSGVREVVLRGALVDTEKIKIYIYFFSFCFWVRWARFSMVVASVDLPGGAQVVLSAGE
jgi:hypothetical protein